MSEKPEQVQLNSENTGLAQSSFGIPLNVTNSKPTLSTQDTVLLDSDGKSMQELLAMPVGSMPELLTMPDSQVWCDTQAARYGLTLPLPSTLTDSQLMPPPEKIPKSRKRKQSPPPSIRMKRKVKTWNKCTFCFAQQEDYYLILNNSLPLRCSITIYNDLAVHNVNKDDRKMLNKTTRTMLLNSDLCGMIGYFDEDAEEKTLFIKCDNKTKLFSIDGNVISNLPSGAFQAKVSLRFQGIFKKDDMVKPMLRLHQLRVDENGSNKTINNSCIFN